MILIIFLTLSIEYLRTKIVQHVICLPQNSATNSKEPSCQYRRHKRLGFDHKAGRTSGGGMATHSSILPGESQKQRSLAGSGPRGCRVGHNRSDLAQHSTCAIYLSQNSIIKYQLNSR